MVASVRDPVESAEIRDVLERVRRLSFRWTGKGLVSTGARRSSRPGRGLEFSGHREWQEGEDVKLLDPLATARTGRLILREMKEDRDAVAWLLVDASASGAFGGLERLKRRSLAEIGSILALSASRGGQRVGLVVFTDRIEAVFPPRASGVGLERLVREIIVPRAEGRGTRVDIALSALQRLPGRGHDVFVLSDFAAPDFSRALAECARRHRLHGFRILDPGEETLPPGGVMRLEDPETGDQITIDASDPALRERFREARLRRSRHLAELFGKVGAHYQEVMNDEAGIGRWVKGFRTRTRTHA